MVGTHKEVTCPISFSVDDRSEVSDRSSMEVDYRTLKRFHNTSLVFYLGTISVFCVVVVRKDSIVLQGIIEKKDVKQLKMKDLKFGLEG